VRIQLPFDIEIGGRIYVAGHYTTSGATNRVFEHDLAEDRWREMLPLQAARGETCGGVAGGRRHLLPPKHGRRRTPPAPIEIRRELRLACVWTMRLGDSRFHDILE
jgi:hypothetical protein